MQQHRALILRSNRFMGSSLVDKGLISSADLEAANAKFMESIQSPDQLKNASILSTLIYDLKKLDENKLLDLIVERNGLGLVDLNFVELRSLRPMNIDSSLCWATSTIPFDTVEDLYMVATTYYLSNPVVKHWEDILNKKIIWYATPNASLFRALERIDNLHEAEDAAAAEEDEEN